MESRHECDVVVIGSGLAGLYTALNVKKDKKVIILAKEKIDKGNSSLAQGGIAAVTDKTNDDYDLHIKDTRYAGSELNDDKALEVLVYEAAKNIDRLMNYGVDFDRDEQGNILRTKEGGHSTNRILHAGGDATGSIIMHALVEEVKKRDNITLFEDTMAIDLITKDNSCYGLYAIRDNKYVKILASYTVIATGGIGSIYKHTTNPDIATGDGIAMAKRADCKINNMEFIQFHPTAFYKKERGNKFLISEAVRGEGAYLVNVDGERFMSKYHHLKELAPRDVVSQSIYREMYDTWSDHVLLDARHLGSDFLKRRFPTIFKELIKSGYDLGKDLVPVTPVEHYSIGGITIDINGKTSINNLFANGECCDSGVHGANRLASNSLLECVVFGRRIAKNINADLNDQNISEVENIDSSFDFNTKRNYNYNNIINDIRQVMSSNVGIVRTKEGLEKARNNIMEIKDKLHKYPVFSKKYFEVVNMVTVALIIVNAALSRKENIGCHYRID